MKPCRDYGLLLSLRAADALAPDEAARLDAHLAGCDACRAELDASEAALRLARLPAPTRAERRLMAELPGRMLEDVRRTDRRRGIVRRLAVAGGIAAAFAAAFLVPVGLRDRQGPEVATTAAVTSPAAPTWQEPDLDSVWQDTAVVDFAADSGDETELAYAASSSGYE